MSGVFTQEAHAHHLDAIAHEVADRIEASGVTDEELVGGVTDGSALGALGALLDIAASARVIAIHLGDINRTLHEDLHGEPNLGSDPFDFESSEDAFKGLIGSLCSADPYSVDPYDDFGFPRSTPTDEFAPADDGS